MFTLGQTSESGITERNHGDGAKTLAGVSYADSSYSVISYSLGELTAAQTEKIRELLDMCELVTSFHSLEWNKIISSEFELDTVVSLVASADEIVGFNIFTNRPGSFSSRTSWSPPRMYEAVYGGPVFPLGFEEAGHILLEEQRRRSRADTLYVVTPPGFDASLLRRARYSVVEAQTVVLDLALSEKELWKGLGVKRRNMIRRAEREGVEVREGCRADVVGYHELLQETLARSGKDALPSSLLRKIVDQLVSIGQASFLVAVRGKTMVAGAVLLHYGATSVYWSGASSVEGRKMAANDLIQWRGMLTSKERGSLTYDLLGIDPLRLPGISAFKMGFGGSVVRYCSGVRRTFLGQVVRGLEALAMPKKTLRKLLAGTP